MSHLGMFRPEGIHMWSYRSTWSVMVCPLFSSSIWFISVTWRCGFSSLYCICLSVSAFVSVFEHCRLGGGGVHDVAFGVTRTLCVVCAVVCGGERQGDTAWFRPGMCDVGRLYNRAGLPEGGQWDGCHPPAPSPLGDDHHTTPQLSGPLNHHRKHTYIMRTNTHVYPCTHWDVCEHAGTYVLECISCRRNDMNTHTTLVCTCFSHMCRRNVC